MDVEDGELARVGSEELDGCGDLPEPADEPVFPWPVQLLVLCDTIE